MKRALIVIVVVVLLISCAGFSFADKTLDDAKVIWIDPAYHYVGVYSDKGLFEFKVDPLGNTKKVLIDSDGNVVNSIVYDDISEISSYTSGSQMLTKYVVLDQYGKFSIDDNYTSLSYSDNSECYTFQKKVANTYKYGALDKKGQMIIEPIYDYLSSFYGDRAVARKNAKAGVIDKSGKIVLDFAYQDVRLTNGEAFAVKSAGVWQLVDQNGNKLNKQIDMQYVEFDDVLYYNTPVEKGICDEFSTLHGLDDYLKIIKNGKIGVCNQNFDIVLEPIYDDLRSSYRDNYISVLKDGTWQIYDLDSGILFGNDTYNVELYGGPHYIPDTGRYAYIKNKEERGLIDDKKLILEPNYETLVVGQDGIYASETDEPQIQQISELTKFDFDGKFIEKMTVDKSFYYTDGVGFYENYGKNYASFVDEAGNAIVKGKFDAASPFVNGVCLIIEMQGQYRYGIVKLAELRKLGGLQ